MRIPRFRRPLLAVVATFLLVAQSGCCQLLGFFGGSGAEQECLQDQKNNDCKDQCAETEEVCLSFGGGNACLDAYSNCLSFHCRSSTSSPSAACLQHCADANPGYMVVNSPAYKASITCALKCSGSSAVSFRVAAQAHGAQGGQTQPQVGKKVLVQ